MAVIEHEAHLAHAVRIRCAYGAHTVCTCGGVHAVCMRCAWDAHAVCMQSARSVPVCTMWCMRRACGVHAACMRRASGVHAACMRAAYMRRACSELVCMRCACGELVCMLRTSLRTSLPCR